MAVLFDRGGYLYWSNNDLNGYRWFGEELTDPTAVFLRDGRLIALGTSEGKRIWQGYTTADGLLQKQFETPCDIEHDVIALLRAGAPNQVGLVTADGKVQIFEIS